MMMMSTSNQGARLSMCASAVHRELLSSHSAHGEVKIFQAPSECHQLINRATRKSLELILARYGYTASTFLVELLERTCYKYLYFTGFLELADIFDCDPFDRDDRTSVAPCDADSSR